MTDMPNTPDTPELDPRTDEAVRERLRRLSTMPVDTTALEKALREKLPARTVTRPFSTRRFLRPIAAVAASLILVASVIFMALPDNTAMADTDRMIQTYEEMVAGKMPGVTEVGSVEEAQRVLAGKVSNLPTIPRLNVAQTDVCCMDPRHNQNVVCLLMKVNGVPVMMSVAKSSEYRMPKFTPQIRDGVAYYCQSARGHSMVVTERNGTAVCLVSKLGQEQLIALASKLEY